MRNLSDKHPIKGDTSIKMVSALRRGFHLNATAEHAICNDQRCSSIELALQQWIRDLLLCPDQQIGMLLMPIIAQRFDEYLTQLQRVEPWNQ